ncbi:MAG: malectin domain-containing carbohydrate-binding protein [Planctomycetota bacterium]
MRLFPFLFLAAPVLQAQSAHIEVGPSGPLTISSSTAGAFVIENTSATERIAEVRFDLTTALFEDLIFDPDGTGGDTAAKDFTADSGVAETGQVSHAFLNPGGGGFDGLQIVFNDFDPGETFTFSLDVDPGTIQGAAPPGPDFSGNVSGLELVGATIEVDFEGGTMLAGELFRKGSSLSESEVDVVASAAPAPTVEVLGAVTPSQVFVPAWTVRLTGTPGSTVTLLQVEGALFTAGVPGGGFDVDPFEANSAVDVVEHQAVLDGSGVADVAITLTQLQAEAGITSLIAVEEDGGGVRGRASAVQVLAFVDVPISFDKHILGSAALSLPTSLQFGPDGRLYVAQQAGEIRIFDIIEDAVGYHVAATEVISEIQQIPNHDDDGSLNAAINTRQVTGILVVGTAQDPVIYVTSSDPRIGAGGSGTDLDLDTNSGVVSRLTESGGVWTRQDLVRGLPRSEENHGPNGMQLDPVTNTLYVAQGGHTNMGAPSNNFALTPEFALSAAILAVDLDAIGTGTFDLPTLDDEDRAGTVDAGDPFGGNNAKNQAKLVPGDPVQIHSPGWRNPYDLVVTEDGRMYAVDNGPNSGWGGIPDLNGGACTNAVVEPGATDPDGVHYISGPGYYAGHPNPTRANPGNTFNPSNPQSPVTVANPVECEYREPVVEDGALAAWNSSTNGIAEYTASAFGGAMAGDLLLISLSQQLRRVKLNAAGDEAVLVEDLFSSVGSGALDVTTLGDADPFPGTIWVANRTGNSISIYVPDDFTPCTGVDSALLDEDGDGYTNADELANGTDPCNGGDFPPDFDADQISDLTDDDDDNDGLVDTVDRFALDPSNGLDVSPPFTLSWETNTGGDGGILGLGFTGMMANGVDDYLDLFEPGDMTVGGAAGVLTVETASSGVADGAANTLQDGFQIGFRPSPTAPFSVKTRIVSPYVGMTPVEDQKIGLFLGTGTQDDFVSVRLTGLGIEFQKEIGGVAENPSQKTETFPGPAVVDLTLEVDPVASTVTGYYEFDGGGPQALPAQPLPTEWFDFGETLAAGLYLSSGSGAPFSATWDFLEVDGEAAPTRINAGGPLIADWQPDDAFVQGGSKFSTTSAVTLDGTVPPLTPMEIFQSERTANQDVSWTFALTQDQTYDVRLYFAEIFFDQPGNRLFDVLIEGQVVLDDYDIVADVGDFVGTMKEFQVTLTGSDLNIQLVKSTGSGPKISAIEILESDGSIPGSVELYGVGLGGANLGSLDSPYDPTILTDVTLDLASMGPSAQALVLFSQTQATIPLVGGTLLIGFPPIADPVFVNLTGEAGTVLIPIPDEPGHAGLVFTCQAAALDAGQVGGWRFSNGVKLTIGSD